MKHLLKTIRLNAFRIHKKFTGKLQSKNQSRNSTLLSKKIENRSSIILLKFLPYFTYLSIVCVLFIQNYIPGTYLTGWDNLHSEFDFWMNIKRSIFAVWQEYQGLGLLGGMGHASDLLRQIFLLLVSFFIPNELLRYFYHFLMLFIGTVGVFKFSSDLITKHFGTYTGKISAFMGGLYYLLNFGTIQYFYVPFEPYSTFWAFFPYLLHSLFLYLEKQNKKRLIYFSLIHVLATPMAYVQTIFAVYILCVFLFLFVYTFSKSYSVRYLFNKARAPISALLVIVIVNAFWLLPNIYFVFNNVSVTQDAMQNKMATEKFFQMNQYRGTIPNFIQLKEFYYDFSDLNQETGQFGFLMQEWRTHASKPWVVVISYVIFSIVFLGIFQKNTYRKYLLFLFGLVLLVFLSDTPPFSFIDSLLRSTPLINQIFRNPFTKFIVPAVFILSVFFSLGIARLLSFLSSEKTKLYHLLLLLFAVMLFALSFPAFNGNYISSKMKIAIPGEYFEMFEYFKTQNPNGRILNLPQQNYWGWYYYDWGLHGSGFIWYGIQQPIMDRAFDVWSRKLENYYWELSYAINKRDKALFNSVLEKYNISYVIFDDNLAYSDNIHAPKADLNQKNLLEDNNDVLLDKQFGAISIYKTAYAKNTNGIKSYTNLPHVRYPEKYSHFDKAFLENQNYISDSNDTVQTYPYGSLFTSRFGDERGFNISDSKDSIIFSSQMQAGSYKITIPSLMESEAIFPVEILAKKNDEIITVRFKVLNPIISVGKNTVQNEFILEDLKLPIGLDNTDSYVLDINNTDFFRMHELDGEFHTLGTTYLTNQDAANSVRIFSGVAENEYLLEPQNFTDTHQCDDSKKAGDINLVIKNNQITLQAKNKAACSLYSHSFITKGTSLWRVDFEYTSTTDEFPQFCLIGRLSSTCLNKKDVITTGFSSELASFSEYFESGNTEFDELFFQSILDATSDEDKDKEKEISYKNFRLQTFPYLSGGAIRFGDVKTSYTLPLTIKDKSNLTVQIKKLQNSFVFSNPIDRNVFKKSLLNYDLSLKGKSSVEVLNENNRTFIRLKAKHSSSYLLEQANNLRPHYGYLASVSSRNMKGFPIVVNTFTNNDLSTYAYTYGSGSHEFNRDYYVLPPYYEFDQGISILLGSTSFSKNETVNDISSIDIHPIPLHFLSAISYGQNIDKEADLKQTVVKNKKNSYYSYTLEDVSENSTIILDQSYSSGWNMYRSKEEITSNRKKWIFTALPFIFGNKVDTHVEINNWENGWVLNNPDPKKTYTIVYTPQYLEFIGFLLLIGFALFILRPYISTPERIKKISIRIDLRSEILKQRIYDRFRKRNRS